jgi:hypothetical protein
MDTGLKHLQLTIILLIACVYAYGWGYASVYSHKFLMNFKVYAGLSYDDIRGFHAIAVGVLWSCVLLAPFFYFYRAVNWLTPTLFGICGYIYIYIVRAMQRDIPLPNSLWWVFEELQSFLVMAAIAICPLLVYGTLRLLLNRFRQADAEILHRR